jgi:hypothetical protein
MLTPTNAWYEPPRSTRAKLLRAARILLVIALIFAAVFAVESFAWTHACDGRSTASDWCQP